MVLREDVGVAKAHEGIEECLLEHVDEVVVADDEVEAQDVDGCIVIECREDWTIKSRVV